MNPECEPQQRGARDWAVGAKKGALSGDLGERVHMVEARGFEPLTSTMPLSRSTN